MRSGSAALLDQIFAKLRKSNREIFGVAPESRCAKDLRMTRAYCAGGVRSRVPTRDDGSTANCLWLFENRRDGRDEPALRRPDFDHVGHEMLQQVLDAVLQRRGGRGAAGAGALHVEVDDAVLEAAKGDVAAITGDRGAHPGFDQVLDGRDRLGVGLVEELVLLVGGLVASNAAVGQ